MSKTTILEKLKIIFEVSKSSKLFLIVIAFIILLAIVALTTNKKNIKRGKSIYAFVYAAIIVTLIILYHDSLGKMFDYMMNNFFIVLYFPNIAVYMSAIIITNIILWISIFNLKTSKIIKTINVIFYGIIHYLLALVLNIISKNNLDIFSQTSIYGNKEAQAIIELTSGIFIIWIIFLTFYKIIRHFQLKDAVPVKQKVIIKKVRKLPETIREVEVPLYVKAQHKKQDAKAKTEDPVIIGRFVEQYAAEQERLKQQLLSTQEQLVLAQQQIKSQANKLQIAVEEKNRLQQEQAAYVENHNRLYETQQLMIQEEQLKLKEEQTKLQQERNIFKQEQIKFKEEKKKPEIIDATTAIMQNIDGMLTLEDYKVLATILREKQRKKNEAKAKTEIRKLEQTKYTQLHEAYRSAR